MRTIALSTSALQKQRCAKRLLLHGSSTTINTQPTQNEWNKVFLQISQRLCVTSRTSSHLGSGPTSRTTYSSPAVSSRAMRRAASVLDRESTAKVIVFSTVALHHEQKWYFAPSQFRHRPSFIQTFTSGVDYLRQIMRSLAQIEVRNSKLFLPCSICVC